MISPKRAYEVQASFPIGRMLNVKRYANNIMEANFALYTTLTGTQPKQGASALMDCIDIGSKLEMIYQ